MKVIKHKHHIIPKHMGGTDEPENLVELTVDEHAEAHLKLYEEYGKKEDLCAYYMLSGKNQDPEFVKLRSQIGGQASLQSRIERGTAHLPFFGANLSDERRYEIALAGGKVQGERNAESGHMTRIQTMCNPSEAGKKGGATTIARGKGSFADPVERLKSASKGGKTQGKNNAESGHLKRIAQMTIEQNPRSKGKQWITNGNENKMIDKSEILPEGFRYGKTQKKK